MTKHDYECGARSGLECICPGGPEIVRGSGYPSETKAIRKLIAWAQAQDADTEAFDGATIGPPCHEALAEVKAIERVSKTAEARGFARAREQAAVLMQGAHGPPCYERPVPKGTTVGECGNCARARLIRAMEDMGEGTPPELATHSSEE
jgi:hypothetical protein